MTESQEAFESMFPEYTKNEDTKKRDLNPSLVQRFLIWQAAEAYGRKQATEIAAPFRPITTDIKMLTDDEAFDVECNSYANTAKAIQQAFCAKNNINLGSKK